MTTNLPHNDRPIETPAEDRFGVDPFARALSASIREMRLPQGSVIGLNGPWGSGKSSAINLCKHHLANAVCAGELVIVDFACWWFRGEDALALAFFRELHAGLAPGLGDKAKKVLPKLGARLLRAGAVVGKVVEAAGAVAAGGIAEKGMEWVAGLIEHGDSVEKLHAELSKALSGQGKRFLVVIDDIDRLSPDEALLIFRLVKSVGQLPNVMYLLVYDRTLAEKIVSERYPSEGPHYLEKIVQAAFELPEPSPIDIQQQLLLGIESICGEPADAKMVRFMNIFHDGLEPAIRTPRDIARFTNSLTVAWPAVAGEVDLADFVALEMLRVLHPAIHRAIRQHKEQLTTRGRDDANSRAEVAKRFDELFFGSVSASQHEKLRRLLRRLFPALEAAWANVTHEGNYGRQWAMERRACSPEHFDTYFRLTVGDDALTSVELNAFLDRVADIEHVKSTMRDAVTVRRRAGGTKAAVWLDGLTTHANRVLLDDIQPLLVALFEIADEINVEADNAKAFAIGNNEMRLHWLMIALTMERMSVEARSVILENASSTASIGWLSDIARSAWTDYHPREGNQKTPAQQCLTTEEAAKQLRALLQSRICSAAQDGSLAAHRDLPYLLHSWAEIAGDDGAAVRAWTFNLLATDDGVKQLANAFTAHSWTQGMGFSSLGDAVARRQTRVQLDGMARLIDLKEFRARVEAVAAATSDPGLEAFLTAWRDAEERRDP